MELDGTVFRRRLGPAVGAAGPVGAGQCPGRHLAQHAVQAIGGAVVDGFRRYADAEIPGGDQVGIGRVGHCAFTAQLQRLG